MRVLIGFESSGVVREAFRARGFDAWSCDLQAADDGSSHHYQQDIWDLLAEQPRWDFAIFHPTCTYLTGSAEWAFGDGPYHQKVKEGTLVGQARRDARRRALADVSVLMDLPFPKVIENPVGAISSAIRRPEQIIQPYEFGDDASKKTCLWLSPGVPLLKKGPYVLPRYVNGKPRWGNQTDSGQNKLSPSDDRWKARSKTYPGIATAMARDWGEWLLNRDRWAA